jgi:hypothetical protein
MGDFASWGCVGIPGADASLMLIRCGGGVDVEVVGPVSVGGGPCVGRLLLWALYGLIGSRTRRSSDRLIERFT